MEKMKRDPYDIDLPAVVSFSGGRTSGYMLRKILDAKGGQPEGLKICFQNTGLEHEATLLFVKECGERWDIKINWLEYYMNEDGDHDWKEVDFETASRNGEPFTDIINKYQKLPNPIARFCTGQLKVRTQKRYLVTVEGFQDGWSAAIGLRADEPHRANRIVADSKYEDICCPLYDAGATEADVLDFWAKQDFDLELPTVGNMAGNCVGCFLKAGVRIESLMRTMPEHFDWWIDIEAASADLEGIRPSGQVFRKDRPSYANIMKQTKAQGMLFDLNAPDDTIDCFCTD